MSSSLLVILRVNGGVQLISIAVRLAEISIILAGAANNPTIILLQYHNIMLHDVIGYLVLPCIIK